MKQRIKISDVQLGYKKSGQIVQVLKDLNLTFDASQLVGIVGLNGVGKSTLLKSIAGLLPLLKGEILIDGIEVNDDAYVVLAKKVAVVLTEKFGGFNLTVSDVVQAGMMPYTNALNQLNAEQIKVVEEAIKLCGLQHHQHRFLEELSDGYFQRTVIAKALAQQTDVILLDEPTAFLDYAAKHDLLIMLKRLCEEAQKCILISSHDLDLLLKYCHKLLVITEDDICCIPVEEAKTNEAFKQIAKGYL